MDRLKDIARKILENPWISQKEACFKASDLDDLREYLSTVWFKLITTYRTRIISVKKRKQRSFNLYNYSNGIVWKSYTSHWEKPKEIKNERTYSIIKL